MSDRTPPPRRRIAGESPAVPPAAPVKKAAGKKAAGKKLPAKKAAPKKVAAPAPTAPKTPAVTQAPAKKATVPAPPVTPAPPAPRVARPAPRATTQESAAPVDRRGAVALAVAVAVLIAGGVVGTLGFLSWRGEDVESSRTAAVSAAGSAAETIFSFSYDELDQHTKDSKALMTPSFAKDFDTIAPALTDIAPERKVVVQSVARNAAALPCGDECSADRVSVLIFIDQDRRLEGEDTTTVFGNRIVVDMVKRDGDWKVNEIRAL